MRVGGWLVVVGQGVMPSRKGYPSDLSDAQWSLIEPLLPVPHRFGGREKHPRRQIVNAIMYLDRFLACVAVRLPALADGVLVLHPVGRTGRDRADH